MFYISREITEITFDTYTRFANVKPVWENFLPENHHLLCPDITAPELSMPEDIEFRYVNIRRRGKLIGVMYLQFLNFNSKHYHHGIFDKPVLKHLKECIVRQEVKIMVCGNLFRVNYQGFWFADKKDKSKIFDCLQLYRKENKMDSDSCGILLKDCSREFAPVQFTCHKFKAFNQDLTMELNIRPEWKTFDNYISDLSRKYRQRAVKIIQSAITLRKTELNAGQLLKEEPRINELYLNIVKKQSLALGILNAAYFRQMKACLEDNFKVFGYYEGDKLIAFSSHIYYPGKNKMEIHYIGLDYDYNSKYNLYFNILYDGIATAIQSSYSGIEMGRTAREAKANAGAHPVENFNYIWIKPGLIRLVFRFIGSWFEKNIGDEWKRRNPFKSSRGNEVNLQNAQN